MWLDRALARTGDDDPTKRSSKARAFGLLVLLELGAEHWRIPLLNWPRIDLLHQAIPFATTALVALGLFARTRRLAFAGLALVQLFIVWEDFPQTANHLYLQLGLLGLLVLLDLERDEEQALLLGSVRWLVIVVFFYAGLQKLVHGYYFRGELFAHFLDRDSFTLGLRMLLPAGEFQRVMAYGTGVGEGPFRFSSPLPIVLSNVAWAAELGVAGLLLGRRTRTAGWILGVLTLLGIEALARELYFGGLMLGALLVFPRGDRIRRLVPVFALYYGWLTLMTLGVGPELYFY